MFSLISRALRGFLAVALFAAILPVAAAAQPAPSYAQRVDMISGTISHFDGPTTMYVNDAKGYLDTVTLHKGTIINPTGIKLEPGFRVTITGHPDGSVFVANEIDTPYHVVSVPVAPYLYGPYGYYPYDPFFTAPHFWFGRHH